MCQSMVDIQSVAAEIRRGKKKIEDRKKSQDKNRQGGHNYYLRGKNELRLKTPQPLLWRRPI